MVAKRREIVLLLFVCTAFVLLARVVGDRGLAPPTLPPLTGRPRSAAPGYELPDLEGRNHRLEDLRGRIVLLNFWATWCGPCREELPALDQLASRHAEDGLVVVGISLDRAGREAVAGFLEGRGIGFPVLLDPNSEVGDRYGVRFYPTSVVIDRQGRLVAHVPSAWDWSAPEVSDWLRAIFDEGAGKSGTP